MDNHLLGRLKSVLGFVNGGMLISRLVDQWSTPRAKTKDRPVGRPVGMLITERSARERVGRPFTTGWCAPADSRTLQLF